MTPGQGAAKIFTIILVILFCRPQYFKLVDKCISQIILHKSGLDPDFHYTQKFNIDVDLIIGKCFFCVYIANALSMVNYIKIWQ